MEAGCTEDIIQWNSANTNGHIANQTIPSSTPDHDLLLKPQTECANIDQSTEQLLEDIVSDTGMMNACASENLNQSNMSTVSKQQSEFKPSAVFLKEQTHLNNIKYYGMSIKTPDAQSIKVSSMPGAKEDMFDMGDDSVANETENNHDNILDSIVTTEGTETTLLTNGEQNQEEPNEEMEISPKIEASEPSSDHRELVEASPKIEASEPTNDHGEPVEASEQNNSDAAMEINLKIEASEPTNDDGESVEASESNSGHGRPVFPLPDMMNVAKNYPPGLDGIKQESTNTENKKRSLKDIEGITSFKALKNSSTEVKNKLDVDEVYGSDGESDDVVNDALRVIMIKCDKCSLAFINKKKLKAHKKTHSATTPKTGKVSDESDVTKNSQNLYICEFENCNKLFARREHWRRHTLIHSDNFPFKCDTCDRGFKRPEHVKRHQTVHTKEKPFICPICDTKFTRSERMKRHIIKQHDTQHEPLQPSPDSEIPVSESPIKKTPKKKRVPKLKAELSQKKKELKVKIVKDIEKCLKDPKTEDITKIEDPKTENTID